MAVSELILWLSFMGLGSSVRYASWMIIVRIIRPMLNGCWSLLKPRISDIK
jgi:hypothetical protein